MLTSTKEILEKANKGNYAVGHFNINNMEIVQGVVAAGVKMRSPLILATSEGAIKYAGLDYLYCLVSTAAAKSNIPIALHLDHGRDLDIIKQCIKMGYSSVMFDGSHLPFKENIRITKKIVQLAHQKGISVEAELGTIGGVEDTIKAKMILYTNPDQAQEFVEKTGCDFLAIAIGTSHGAYKFKAKAKLNIDLLKEINKRTKIPLVLHGASGVPSSIVHMAERYGADLHGVKGVPNDELRKAVRNGINKVNSDTDLRLAFDAGVRWFVKKKPTDFDPRHILAPAREMIQKVVEDRIMVLGSKGKA
ncbi:MAG: class II fructose-1,6-bisphosphate aldolase [Candidatus Woesearchaeota archaeon]